MESLSPDHVPVYDTPGSGRELWERCARDGRPVVAVRDGARGFVVRYDLGHLGVELSPRALRALRDRVLAYRHEEPVPDAVSQVERLGGEISSTFAVLGDYDFHLILQVPDEETAFQATQVVERHGLDTKTLQALPLDRLGELVDDV